LYRAATAYLRAGCNGQTADGQSAEVAARALFGNDPPTRALIQRAASSPATTTGAGWADAFVQRSVFDAVQSPTSVSAAAALIARALHVDLTAFAQVVVPGRIVTADAAGQFVGEAGAKPVRMLNFSSVTLEPHAIAFISDHIHEGG
jgi:hypothetical protein